MARMKKMEINQLLEKSLTLRASDLHLSPGLPPLVRIDGELTPIEGEGIIDAATTETLIYSFMDAKQLEEFKRTHECDFAIGISDSARFRVNVFLQANGVSAALRAIPPVIPTFEDLDSPPVFKKMLEAPNGLILVTGPTGSGKSTTLAAMINHINGTKRNHIVTIEDPIEFSHKSKKSLISQRQVHRDTIDFSAALRSALREDPDVILVGEMRDLETIRLALTAAETGHLVLATLHTSSAPQAVNRIVDVFPAAEKDMIRNMISESLQAVICQTLIKKPAGGRVAAYEIMVGTPAVRNLIRESQIAQLFSAMQMGSAFGMCTMEQYRRGLVDKKIITEPTANESSESASHSH